ncbi:hypothetical protein X975_04189, partial [Stegodyphus mimosarum]
MNSDADFCRDLTIRGTSEERNLGIGCKPSVNKIHGRRKMKIMILNSVSYPQRRNIHQVKWKISNFVRLNSRILLKKSLRS